MGRCLCLIVSIAEKKPLQQRAGTHSVAFFTCIKVVCCQLLFLAKHLFTLGFPSILENNSWCWKSISHYMSIHGQSVQFRQWVALQFLQGETVPLTFRREGDCNLCVRRQMIRDLFECNRRTTLQMTRVAPDCWLNNHRKVEKDQAFWSHTWFSVCFGCANVTVRSSTAKIILDNLLVTFLYTKRAFFSMKYSLLLQWLAEYLTAATTLFESLAKHGKHVRADISSLSPQFFCVDFPI